MSEEKVIKMQLRNIPVELNIGEVLYILYRAETDSNTWPKTKETVIKKMKAAEEELKKKGQLK